MIARSVWRCSTTRPSWAACRLRSSRAKQCRYSTTSSTGQTNGASPASMLAVFTNELDKIAPRFDINGSQVQIIRAPSEFYETLKAKIRQAEDRIFLSTLYIGKTEHELISVLHDALKSKPALKLYILTDALRGTRESPEASCASLLAPLIADFGPERVQIRMYHTPNLTGLRKKYIPKRINEGWGLQHMKLYGIDDEIIISGANLSNDYFNNRQDRYHLFSSKDITEYFWKIHNAVSELSFLVAPESKSDSGYQLVWPTSNPAPCPLEHPQEYISHATTLLSPLIKPVRQSLGPLTNTSVYPLFQMTQLLPPDTSTEMLALKSLLSTLSSPTFHASTWTFTAGYFNPDPILTKLLISTASSTGTVVTASPWANGFYGSRGVSGLLPGAYTLLERRFLSAVAASGRKNSITLREWRHGTVGTAGGWSYHAKGLWVSLPSGTLPSLSFPLGSFSSPGDEKEQPSMTLIGSSNYTQRSYALDLEANALVVTRDGDLKRRLAEERDWLLEDTEVVSRDDLARVERRVGWRVRVAMWIVGMVGGAL